jgi:hypothetical protein
MLPAETDGGSGIENGGLQNEPGLYLADAGEGLVCSGVELGGAGERIKELGYEAVKCHQTAHAQSACEHLYAAIADHRAHGHNNSHGTAQGEPDAASELLLL